MNKANHQILLPHHSSPDWDFYFVSDWSPYTTWDITSAYYVSPPCCVDIGHPTLEVYALSKDPQAQNLMAGRLTCWVRSVLTGVGAPRFYIGVTGPGSSGISFIPYEANYIFIRTRYTWWQGKDAEGNPKTVVFREKWEDEKWLDKGITYHDPLVTGRNRVGIGSTPQSLGYMRGYDNTIIERWTYDPCY